MSNEQIGPMVNDEDRCAFGLGWEYRRRGLSVRNCPFVGQRAKDFLHGFHAFVCTKDDVNTAMIGGTINRGES